MVKRVYALAALPARRVVHTYLPGPSSARKEGQLCVEKVEALAGALPGGDTSTGLTGFCGFLIMGRS